MPQRTLELARPIDQIWSRLQDLGTWEGVGGLTNLRYPRHDQRGDLTRFAFSLETPLGAIRDEATVRCAGRTMNVVAESKGLEVAVRLSLQSSDEETTIVAFAIEGRSTNFLTRPLAGTLQATLEANIDGEAQKMTKRLEEP